MQGGRFFSRLRGRGARNKRDREKREKIIIEKQFLRLHPPHCLVLHARFAHAWKTQGSKTATLNYTPVKP